MPLLPCSKGGADYAHPIGFGSLISKGLTSITLIAALQSKIASGKAAGPGHGKSMAGADNAAWRVRCYKGGGGRNPSGRGHFCALLRQPGRTMESPWHALSGLHCAKMTSVAATKVMDVRPLGAKKERPAQGRPFPLRQTAYQRLTRFSGGRYILSPSLMPKAS